MQRGGHGDLVFDTRCLAPNAFRKFRGVLRKAASEKRKTIAHVVSRGSASVGTSPGGAKDSPTQWGRHLFRPSGAAMSVVEERSQGCRPGLRSTAPPGLQAAASPCRPLLFWRWRIEYPKGIMLSPDISCASQRGVLTGGRDGARRRPRARRARNSVCETTRDQNIVSRAGSAR